MINSIRQRIYITGVLPLALLAVTLVGVNGAIRIRDGEQELRNARSVTAQLLYGPASDALIIGDTLGFRSIAEKAVETSRAVVCISLSDSGQRVLVAAGRCDASSSADVMPIRRRANDLSDFDEATGADVVMGELRITMNKDAMVRRRNAVLVQLAFSFLLIGVVIGVVGRLLRSRLITPIESIDQAMHALSQRDYSANVHVIGRDELARLGVAVNETISTIARYTRELEQRRREADGALQEADEAALAKDALVRTLAVDLQTPLGAMHSRLTEIAMANTDAELKRPIREVIGALQEAQANLADLLEVASTANRRRRELRVAIADVIAQMELEVRRVSEKEHLPVHFTATTHPSSASASSSLEDKLVALDVSRWRKAVLYLIRGMSRRCIGTGVFITAEFIEVAPNEVCVSVQFKALYADGAAYSLTGEVEGESSALPPKILGWSEREERILGYLLREIDVAPAFSLSTSGVVNVLLQTRKRYSFAEEDRSKTEGAQPRPILALIVSDDPSMARLATRSDLTNDEVRAILFADAFATPESVHADVLVIDLSSDVTDAFSLLEMLKAREGLPQVLVAVCAPGNIAESLSERLFDLGFAAVLQKPLHYARLHEVIRAITTSSSLGLVRS